MGLLNHQALQIVKGVGKMPGDTTSGEQDPVVIDLMSLQSGFSLSDWSPNIPSLKSGGVWADSPVADGRYLVSGVNTNVIETITVNLAGSTCQAFAANFAALQRMVQDARAFFDSFYQAQPVYLKWWAVGAPGPQYALIFNIDMKVTFEDSSNTLAEIILSVEREFGWRGIAPGANPRVWSFYSRNNPSGFNTTTSDFNTSDLSPGYDLVDRTTIYNHLEVSGATASSVVKQNWLDIPAAKVPGDLPALAHIIYAADNDVAQVYMSRDTLPHTNPVTGIAYQQQLYDLSASMGSILTDVTRTNDTGGIIFNGSAARRSDCSFATVATLTDRIGWTLNYPMHHTRWIAFARMRQSAGTTGDIKVSLRTYGLNSNSVFTTPESNVVVQAGAGNTTDWPVTYMGILQLPPTDLYSSRNGRGIEAAAQFTVALAARRTAGVGLLYVCDVMLVPISEGAALLLNQSDQTLVYMLDTTGYFTHGLEGINNPIAVPELELRGQALTLLPNVENRIYFFSTVLANTSRVGYTADVGVNIVPRWSGIRDI